MSLSRGAAPGLRSAVGVGRRAFIRYPVENDRAEFLALIEASRDFHKEFAPMPHGAEELWRGTIQQARSRDVHRLLVCRLDDGAIAGRIAVTNICRHKLQSGTLGYWVGAPFARQGLMTEGLRLVVRSALLDLRLHRVEACIQPANTESIALVKRCGFLYEGFSPRLVEIGGVWRDHERWAITIEDWEKLPADVRAEPADGTSDQPK